MANKKNRYANQAEAFYQLIKSNEAKYLKGSHHFNSEQKDAFNRAYSHYENAPNRPALSGKTIKQIQLNTLKKQRHKYKKLRNQSMLRYAGAIGLTFLAIGMIPGVGQAVLAAGIAITAAVSIAKLYHVYKHWNSHRLSSTEKKHIESKTHFLIDEFTVTDTDEHILNNFVGNRIACKNDLFQLDVLCQHYKQKDPNSFNKQKIVAELQHMHPNQKRLHLTTAINTYKKRIVIAYNYHKQTRGNDYTLKDFMEGLNKLTFDQSIELLNRAESRYRQDCYLSSKALKSHPSNDERNQFLQSLSPKHRIHMIKQCVKDEKKADRDRAHHHPHAQAVARQAYRDRFIARQDPGLHHA